MKVISWNVNGLRAVYKRNFLDWVSQTNPDILCLQEIKLQQPQLPPELLDIKGYKSYFNCAQKTGYSGVAVYSKMLPQIVEDKLSHERFDSEGRMLRLEFPEFTLFNLYMPHGDRTQVNLPYKLEVYSYLLKYLEKFKDKKVILTGDFNVAHGELDLARPKQNKNNIMFTEDERRKINSLLKLGFVDTFRSKYPNVQKFTWWPYFATARQRNLGWRIDYVFVSESLAGKVRGAFILSEVLGSDHCPVGIEI